MERLGDCPRSFRRRGRIRALVFLASLFPLKHASYPLIITGALIHWEIKEVMHVSSCQLRSRSVSMSGSALDAGTATVDETGSLHSKKTHCPTPSPHQTVPPSPAKSQLPLSTPSLGKAGWVQCCIFPMPLALLITETILLTEAGPWGQRIRLYHHESKQHPP